MSKLRSVLLTLLPLLSIDFQVLAAAEEIAAVKNVLFVIADDLKCSVLGCYGDPICQTPNIDRLAQDGLVFERAYCQGTWCAPSRQSLMFGRYVDAEGTNMGAHFRNHGWYTARVGKIYHMRVPGDIIAGTNGKDVASSWTERFNSPGREAHTPGDYACLNLNLFTRSHEGRQSTRMPHRPFVSVVCDGDGSDQPDYKTATKAIELLRAHKSEPFFLAVGFIRPHYPMVQPRQYFAAYPWQDIELPETVEADVADIPQLGIAGTNNANNALGRYPDNQKRMWSAYYASVSFMDAQLGRVLDELDRLGLRESTAIVFTSDHGYHLGEHGFWQKSNLHEEVIRVPLIVSAAAFQPGRTRAFAELLDIYPTVSELAGLEVPTEVEGTSLVPVLSNADASVRNGAISFNKGASLRVDGWHYMRYHDDSVELYDMNEDPKEFTNLAGRAEYSAIQTRLDTMLRERLEQLKR